MNFKYRFNTLKKAFFLMILPFILLLTILVFVFIQWNQFKDNRNNLLSKKDYQLQMQSILLADPLWNLNKSRIDTILNLLIEDSDIVGLSIFDEDDLLFSSTGIIENNTKKELEILGFNKNESLEKKSNNFRQFLPALGFKNIHTELFFGSTTVNYIYKDEIRNIGTLYIVFSDENRNNISHNQMISVLMLLCFIFVIISVSINITYQLTVGKPLLILKKSVYRARKEQGVAEEENIFNNLNEVEVVNLIFNKLWDEQKQAEEKIRKHEQEFRELVENAPDIIFRFDKEFRHTYVNQAVEAATGISKQSYIGRTHRELGMPEEIAVFFQKNIQNVFETGQKNNFEFSFPTPTGKKYYESRYVPEYNNNNSIESVLGVTRDITERKQVEEALLESEDKFRTLFEFSPIGMAMIDHESGDFLEVNNTVLKQIGYTKEEFIALNFWNITPKKYDKQEADQREALNNTGRFGPSEKEYIRKDGSRYPIKISGFLMANNDGHKVVWGFIEDLTEIKRKEEEKAQLQQQLNHRNKMDSIGELAGGMAHDFNNVLSGILSASELLRLPKNGLNEKSLKYVGLITQASIRASDLISKLLVFSRKGKFVTKTLDIHDILNDTAEILRGTIDKKISISVAEYASNNKFIGDFSAIESALINLGINSSHAMPDGGIIEFKTKNIYLDQSYCDLSSFNITAGEYLQIGVKDTGSGISKENLQKIFDPFFTTKKQGKGTGLGLSVVYGTIQDHNGVIEVLSEERSGTTFYILFPCTEQVNQQFNEISSMATGSGTILFVDDEEMNRTLSKEILESLGYKVLLAENGLESVEIFSHKHSEIDIVLMDLIMPKMNGSEAFYKMKEIDKNCKVILASGYTQDENVDELMKNGLAGFINKPYKISDISKELDRVQKSL